MTDLPEAFAQAIAQIRGGNPDAMGALLQRHESWLQLLARLQVDTHFQGKFSASDIVQQTMLHACEDLPQFRGQTEAEFLAWLRQILAHVLAHEIRRYRGTQQRNLDLERSLDAALDASSRQIADFLGTSQSSAGACAARREEEVILATALAKLPADYRDVIVLRNLEGLSHEDVAIKMGRSPGAVRMLWVRALAQLKAMVQAENS